MFRPNKFQLLFSPDDANGTGLPGEMSKEDIIKFMGDEEEKETLDIKPEKKEKEAPKKEKEDSEDEDDELDESAKKETDEDEEDDLDEFEEIDEEKLELITPVRRKEILAKYPNIFKDFPHLEKAYYREQKFTELLPTIDDAKAAVEKSKALDDLESDLLSGDNEKLLLGLKQDSPESFNKLVDNYLPNLAKVDKDAFFHVIGNVVKNTISSMVQESRRSQNEALETAALLLNQFVFGSSEFEPAKPLSRATVDKGEEKVSEREQQFNQRQFDTAKNDLNTRVDNVLKSTIEGNIDPNGSMTDYVKKNAIRDANERLNILLDSDTRLKSIIDRLWEDAFNNDFSPTSVNKIKSAYLSRAKNLLPEVIKKARNEALKGMGKRGSSDEKEERKKGPLPTGRSASSSNSGKSAKEQAKGIPANMKTVDYFMQD